MLVTVVMDIVDTGHVVGVVVMEGIILDKNAIDVVMVTVNVVQDDAVVNDVVVVVANLLSALRVMLIAASLNSWIVVLECAIFNNWWSLSAWLTTWLTAWSSSSNWCSCDGG